MRTLAPFAFAFAFALATAACPSAEPEPPAYEPPGPWASLDFDERVVFMTRLVQPEMQAIFEEFDPEGWPDFACETCHGPDGAELDWAMPNGVAPLALSDFPFEEHEDPQQRALGLWMEDTVIVRMAEYTGEEVALDGMSCTDCHALQPLGG